MADRKIQLPFYLVNETESFAAFAERLTEVLELEENPVTWEEACNLVDLEASRDSGMFLIDETSYPKIVQAILQARSGCPGWAIFNADDVPEVQACDNGDSCCGGPFLMDEGKVADDASAFQDIIQRARQALVGLRNYDTETAEQFLVDLLRGPGEED